MVGILKRADMTLDRSDILGKSYYTPESSGSFGGVGRLSRATGVSRRKAFNWLKYKDTYTLHKPVQRKFKRRKIIVAGKDYLWQCDLIDLRMLKRFNDGFAYLLSCIDVFSKYAWVVPIKHKTGGELVTAFEIILSSGRKPLRLQTDKGTEFRNRIFQDTLKQNGIAFYVTENDDIKASVVERFNRTIKEKLFRYFTSIGSNRFIEIIPKLVESYNNSYHRSIKTTPASVNLSNQEDIWQTLYGEINPSPIPKLAVGDRVRLSKTRLQFAKGYLPNWTGELFTISKVQLTNPPTYQVRDDNDETIEGTFYEKELQKVAEKEIYRIEEVLKTKKSGNKKMYLVKWFGYPSTFNSWVPEQAIQNYFD